MYEAQLMLQIPTDQVTGASPDFFRAWPTATSIVLDFCAQTSEVMDTEDGAVVHGGLISRVRIPYSQAFELIKTINALLDHHEKSGEREDGDDPDLPAAVP